MTREELIEALGSELRSYESCKHAAEYGGCVFAECSCEHKAKTMIKWLETALGIDLTAIAEGRAVVLPVEPTAEMFRAGILALTGYSADIYRAMIAARGE